MDLTKRFSLDYLISGSKGTDSRGGRVEEQIGREAAEQAVKAYVSPVLRMLDASPEKRQRIFNLYDSVQSYLPGTQIDGFRDVIKWMQGMDLIKVVEADSHGNDLIAKT